MRQVRQLAIQRVRELREVGRIRCGEQRKTQGGKAYPAGRDTFRFTSADRIKLDTLCAVHGGTVKPWEGHRGMWEYDSKCSQLKCLVAPGDSISQVYEQWSGGGCTHRCDGAQCHRVVIKKNGKQDAKGNDLYDVEEFDEGCSCDPYGAGPDEMPSSERACNLTTRLKVMLPDTKDLGLWRLESHGEIFGGEVYSAIEQFKEMNLGPVYCILTLGWQEMKKPGQPTSKFVVPSLSLDPNPPNFARTLMASTLTSQLRTALEANSAPALEQTNFGTPTVPDDLEVEKVEAHLVDDEYSAGAAADAGEKTEPKGDAKEVGEASAEPKAEPKAAEARAKSKPAEEDLTPMPENHFESREESLARATAGIKDRGWSVGAADMIELKTLAKAAGLPWHVLFVLAENAGHDADMAAVISYGKQLAERKPSEAELFDDAELAE